MKKIVKKHPLAIRWFHWVNFPVLTIMIWSGLLIYWANDVYRLGWGNTTLIKFFPQSFYDAMHIPFRLSTGMAFHFFFMWFFFLNGVLYVLYTVFSGEWRYLLPNRHSFKEAWLVVLHDLPTGAMAHLDRFIGCLQAQGFELTQQFPPDCLPVSLESYCSSGILR